jgi:hypothetical protein
MHLSRRDGDLDPIPKTGLKISAVEGNTLQLKALGANPKLGRMFPNGSVFVQVQSLCPRSGLLNL